MHVHSVGVSFTANESISGEGACVSVHIIGPRTSSEQMHAGARVCVFVAERMLA